ncbi:Acetylcholinesterase [Nibea albiflora]|uniref:Acetylcholinesterase n=1 Tax=Nibea albiflora TaxID=240163 RepID=A0ACB7EVV9_NIBAL|nr:Acetylcholinesterase [Nibea albiflora]
MTVVFVLGLLQLEVSKYLKEAKNPNVNHDGLVENKKRWPVFTNSEQKYVELNTEPLKIHKANGILHCDVWLVCKQQQGPQVFPNQRLKACMTCDVSVTDNIDEAERQWKVEFHRWSSYMMHWKSQFDHYSKQERCTDL